MFGRLKDDISTGQPATGEEAGQGRQRLRPLGPVAKFENGCGMGRAEPHFTMAIRGPPSLEAEPIRPFLASLTNFATGPRCCPIVSLSIIALVDSQEQLPGSGHVGPF